MASQESDHGASNVTAYTIIHRLANPINISAQSGGLSSEGRDRDMRAPMNLPCDSLAREEPDRLYVGRSIRPSASLRGIWLLRPVKSVG